jgi:hypothetical protein
LLLELSARSGAAGAGICLTECHAIHNLRATARIFATRRQSFCYVAFEITQAAIRGEKISTADADLAP